MIKNIHKWLIVLTILACLVLVFAVILPAVYAPRTDTRQFQEVIDLTVCFWVRAQSPEELEQVSDIVVLFTPHEYVTKCANRGFDCTITSGAVDRVISGDIRQSEQIEIIEYCWFNETKVKTVECYYPMNIGQTYLLFLCQVDDPEAVDYGRYYVAEQHRGKYVLNARTDFLSRLYLDVGTEFELAVNEYTQVLAERYVEQWYMPMRELYPDVFA